MLGRAATRAAAATAAGLLLAAALFGAWPAAAARQPPGNPALADAPVQDGLSFPWDLAFAPDGRMFVTERGGTLRVYASGAPAAPLLSATAIPVWATGEAGLMGLALDPDFATNGSLYLCATRDDGGQLANQLLRYVVDGDTPSFESSVIRTGMAANSYHDGCRVRFGPDGKLWVTMGDAGRQDVFPQDPDALNGKVLRLNSDGTIPDDNPVLPGQAAPSAVYTLGHRNPQGIAFQPGTGLPFVSEHAHHRPGPIGYEHDAIYVLQPGANFGWPAVADPDSGFAQPAWTSGSATLAASGATFVTGDAWGPWDGSLFVATLAGGDLRRFDVQGTTVSPAETFLAGAYGRLRTPVLGPDGALYVTTSAGADLIVRVSPT